MNHVKNVLNQMLRSEDAKDFKFKPNFTLMHKGNLHEEFQI